MLLFDYWRLTWLGAICSPFDPLEGRGCFACGLRKCLRSSIKCSNVSFTNLAQRFAAPLCEGEGERNVREREREIEIRNDGRKATWAKLRETRHIINTEKPSKTSNQMLSMFAWCGQNVLGIVGAAQLKHYTSTLKPPPASNFSRTNWIKLEYESKHPQSICSKFQESNKIKKSSNKW